MGCRTTYLFVSRSLAASLESCVVVNEEYGRRIEQFSDQNPVVVESYV